MCRVLHPKIRRDILARRFVRRLIRRRDDLLKAIADGQSGRNSKKQKEIYSTLK